MLITRDRYPSDISTWFSCLRRLSSIRRPNRKTEEGFCRFAEPPAGVITRAERLPVTGAVITGNGNESGVDWRSTEETDQKTLVVDAVDNRRTDSIRIIYRLEALGSHCEYESVRVVQAVGVRSDHLPLVI